MRMMVAALALTATVWGCDAKAATEPAPQEAKTYTATLKIDDV